MRPDDRRHGKSAGYVAGCREQCCKDAIADWTRHYRTRLYLRGDLTIDGRGTRRRIRALMVLGWSTTRIDEEIGKRRTYTAAVLCNDPAPVRRETAEMYERLYARLSMKLPPADTRGQRQAVSRVRNYARSQGWAPPLAYDDIDTDAEPTGIYAKPTNPTEWQAEHTARRAADLEHAVEHGRTLEQAADDLKITVKAIEKWCKRRERMDLIAALRKRSVEREMGVAS